MGTNVCAYFLRPALQNESLGSVFDMYNWPCTGTVNDITIYLQAIRQMPYAQRNAAQSPDIRKSKQLYLCVYVYNT